MVIKPPPYIPGTQSAVHIYIYILNISKMASQGENIKKARLAEMAERYEDMAKVH